MAGTDFARLVISDEPSALRALDRAVRDPRPCCIVAVQMVTEGFDCPQVSTIAYAHNITAELYLTQMVARAMRLTPTERAEGRVLPAQVLIPDVPDLRRAFVNVLVSKLHSILPGDEHDGSLFARDGSDAAGGLRLPRYDLAEVSIPRLDDTVVIGEVDGRVTRPEVEAMSEILAGLGLGQGAANVFAPRAVVASRHFSNARVLRDRIPVEVTTRSANPRDINLARRDQAKRCAGWWVQHGDTPISHFQAEANRAAGIRAGGRDNATPEAIDRMVRWMSAEIQARCEGIGIDAPSFLAIEAEDI